MGRRWVAVKWLLAFAVVAALVVLLWPWGYEPRPRAIVVSIDPRTVDIRPELTHGAVSKFESFAEVTARLKPHAAIVGTFYGSRMEPLGDILIDGKLENKGIYPCAIGITANGRVDFIWRKDDKFDWSGYKCGLAAGPRLVHNGEIDADPVAGGFTKKGLANTATRSGIGKTKDGKLLLVVTTEAVTLRKFGEIMRNRGCVEAMNLDGGPACALYHDGKVLVNPTLRMTNVLAFYKKPWTP